MSVRIGLLGQDGPPSLPPSLQPGIKVHCYAHEIVSTTTHTAAPYLCTKSSLLLLWQ